MPETQQRSEARPPMGFPFLTADDQPLFAARAKGVARCSRDALSGRLWPTPGTDYRRNGPVNAQLPLQCSQLANGSQVAYGAEVKTSPASIRDGLGSRHEQRPSIGGWRTADTATRPARPLQSWEAAVSIPREEVVRPLSLPSGKPASHRLFVP